MSSYKVVKVGHVRVTQHRVEGVYAAAYRFTRHRVYVERDGTTSEVPFEQLRFVLRLPGKDRSLWLSPGERHRVLEALQEVDPLGGSSRQQPPQHDGKQGSPPAFPSGGEAMLPEEEYSLRERMVVHRLVEWVRVHDGWPEDADAQPLGWLERLGCAVPDEPRVRRLLADELVRADDARIRVDADSSLAGQECDEHLTEAAIGLAEPADPYGELAGEQPGVSRLLGRRVDEDVADGGEG